ncbi:MAG: DUF4886 domain-containing protein [Clostridia bacterium]|nr:DUF4886 domain-containing protein [Clostridia bacterium]
MKRILSFTLMLLLLLPLSSCAPKLITPYEESAEETSTLSAAPLTGSRPPLGKTEESDRVTKEAPTVPIPQSEKEKRVLKLLILGNSHSLDAFQLLYEAFRDQAPEMDVDVATMYYSGCSISQHVNFATANKPVYRYSVNKNGTWVSEEEFTMARALRKEQWDVVLLQAAKADLDDTLNLKNRRKLEDFVREHIPTEHVFAWHTSWPSPNDETFFSPDYKRQPPAGYKENLIKLYGFNPVTQFSVLTQKARDHILTDPTYAAAYCTGAAIMYAHRVLGVPQLDLWRDYTHLNDYGRIIVAYALYTQITGNEVKEIGLDMVPKGLRHYTLRSEGDLILTEEMKRVIIESANHALHDPWTAIQ